MSARMCHSVGRKLVAEASRHSDLMTTLRAAAVEDGLSGLGGHTNEKAVDLGAAAAVGLERALGHDIYPVCENNLRSLLSSILQGRCASSPLQGLSCLAG